MTRTAGAPIGCQRPSRFWGLGCPKIYHEAEDTLTSYPADPRRTAHRPADHKHRAPRAAGHSSSRGDSSVHVHQ
ncbi:hypothetical protein, partial [Thiolapillus sp.]|uniref:hypothetical protein n=1 Tax=Thiolapillus sp. TaxID=2017437 RepID=UPI003AF7A272